MRLFVSIDLPPEICSELNNRLPELPGWKKARVEQIHLTLFFIGECSNEEKDEIIAELDQVSFSPFEMEIEGLGVFPGLKNPKILWNSVRQNEELLSLQKSILKKLDRFSKKPVWKKFIPHITVARRKSGVGSDRQIDRLLKMEFPAIQTGIRYFSLKKSILKPAGSVHSVLQKFYSNGDS